MDDPPEQKYMLPDSDITLSGLPRPYEANQKLTSFELAVLTEGCEKIECAAS